MSPLPWRSQCDMLSSMFVLIRPSGCVYSLFLAVVLLGGCAHSRRRSPDAVKDPAQFVASLVEKTKGQKVIVFCMQSDVATNQRLEAYMADYLNKNGFHSESTRDIFRIRDVYTPMELLEELRAKGIVGIIEVAFSGKLNADGVPENYTLLYRRLKVKKKYVVDKRYASATGALVQLLLVMPLMKN